MRTTRALPPWQAALLLLLSMTLLPLLLSPSPVHASECSNSSAPGSTALRTGDVLHIAVLVWVDAPHGLFTGDLSDTTVFDHPFATTFLQAHYLGVEMYVKRMRARGGSLPLPDGESVELNFVYINLANTPIPPSPDWPPGSSGGART